MAGKARPATGKKAAPKKAAPADLKSVLAQLKRGGSAKYKADMAARYGIITKAEVYGTPVGALRTMEGDRPRSRAGAAALGERRA